MTGTNPKIEAIRSQDFFISGIFMDISKKMFTI